MGTDADQVKEPAEKPSTEVAAEIAAGTTGASDTAVASAAAAEVEPAPVGVTLTIDGRPVTVAEGTLVIRAAEELGIHIPRFCDHPLLAPVGACRQCLVEIPDAGNGRGFPKPQASCTIPVAEGMVVATASPVAAKAQAGVLELLLINHPLDCPVCDKGGECPLQDQAMSNGQTESRFALTGGIKRTFPKPIPLSANILLDRERCVLCQRCTRFADEIAGDPGIALIERGAHQQVGLGPASDGGDEPFSSYFSGNIIQICPVGALTSTQYRFRSRPFDLVTVPGVSEHDSCGAALTHEIRRDQVMRRMASDDPEVNQEWLSDRDRFGFAYLTDRITRPLIREDGKLREAAWTEAFAVAAAGLSGRRAGLLTGGRITTSDAASWGRFARQVLGSNDIDFRSRPVSVEESDFLRDHAVHRPTISYAELETAPVVVLVGLEPEDEATTIFLRLRAAVRTGQTKVIAVAPLTSPGSAKLGAELIRTAPGGEADALAALDLPAGAIVLAGERLALSPGALTAVAALSARNIDWAWVPRRAGDRGALEAGLIPGPGGHDTDAILAAARAGEIETLVIGGVDLADLADPTGALVALERASFVVSLEQRLSAVTEHADVVFPVAAVTEKDGEFITWDGRSRHWSAAIASHALTDARVLAGIAAELGRSVRKLPGSKPALNPAGASAPKESGSVKRTDDAVSGKYQLSTWRLLLDNAALLRGDTALAATARPAVIKVSATTAATLGGLATVTGDRGSLTLPVEIADLADDVVWVPTYSVGAGLWADVASPGSRVDLAPATSVGEEL